MLWRKCYTINHAQPPEIVKVNHAFVYPTFAVKVVCQTAKPTWRRAGYIYPKAFLSEIGIIESRAEKVDLATQFVSFPLLRGYSFTLELLLHEWISNVNLTFWEPDPNTYPLIIGTGDVQQQINNLEERIVKIYRQ